MHRFFFPGSALYMAHNYHDGIAICREYGCPDFFVTFACKIKWREIVGALASEFGQTADDRPDIVTRVFHMKLMEFLNDMKEGLLFGEILACMYSSLLFFMPVVIIVLLVHFAVLLWTSSQPPPPHPPSSSLTCPFFYP